MSAKHGLVLSIPIIVWMIYAALFNPMDGHRAQLATALAGANAPGMDGQAQRDFAAIQQAIAARPGLWGELVPAPPAPAAPPRAAAPPSAPDLAAMLEGVRIGRGQIGENKLRIHTPDAPDGEWVAVGTTIQGCIFTAFTPEEAIFTHYWEQGGRELSIALPRP